MEKSIVYINIDNKHNKTTRVIVKFWESIKYIVD